MQFNRKLQSQRNWLSVLAAVLSATLVAACGTSAPARFYTLDAGTAMSSAVPALASRNIIVGPIDLPAYLDYPQMAIRGEQGEVTYLEYQRWAEPLGDAFLRIFTEDLGIATGSQQVVAAPIPQRLPMDYRVLARVSRFDTDQTGKTVLAVQWFATDAAGKIIVSPKQASYSRVASLPLESGGIVEAMSGLIADFAVDVARTLGSTNPSTGAAAD